MPGWAFIYTARSGKAKGIRTYRSGYCFPGIVFHAVPGFFVGKWQTCRKRTKSRHDVVTMAGRNVESILHLWNRIAPGRWAVTLTLHFGWYVDLSLHLPENVTSMSQNVETSKHPPAITRGGRVVPLTLHYRIRRACRVRYCVIWQIRRFTQAYEQVVAVWKICHIATFLRFVGEVADFPKVCVRLQIFWQIFPKICNRMAGGGLHSTFGRRMIGAGRFGVISTEPTLNHIAGLARIWSTAQYPTNDYRCSKNQTRVSAFTQETNMSKSTEPVRPEWLDATPEEISSYELAMFTGAGEAAQSIDLKRAEYIALKRHLAALRDIGALPAESGANAPKEKDDPYAELERKWFESDEIAFRNQLRERIAEAVGCPTFETGCLAFIAEVLELTDRQDPKRHNRITISDFLREVHRDTQ